MAGLVAILTVATVAWQMQAEVRAVHANADGRRAHAEAVTTGNLSRKQDANLTTFVFGGRCRSASPILSRR